MAMKKCIGTAWIRCGLAGMLLGWVAGPALALDMCATGQVQIEQELTLEQAAQRALELTGQGFGPTAAAKAAAQGTPYSKSEVYKQLLVLQQGQQAAE